MIWRRLSVALVAALAAMVLTGCWGRLETNELELAAGLGVDWQGGQYVVTAAVFNTRAVTTPGNPASNPTGPETVFLIGRGENPGSALADVDLKSSRHILWATAQVLVLGEGLARNGIGPVLDAFVHEPWFRPTTRVIVSWGDAQNIFRPRVTGVETSVSRELLHVLQNGHQDESIGWSPHVFDLFRYAGEEQRALLIPGVLVVEPSLPTGTVYQMPDSAVLENERLVAWMPRPDVRLTLWVEGLFIHGTFTIPCPGTSSDSGAVYVYSAGRSVKPVFTQGQLRAMDVRLRGRASLVKSCPGLDQRQLDAAATAAVDRQARQAIAWAQEHGYDVFGWGNEIFQYAPGPWRRQYAAQWPTLFARLPVRLHVRVTVPETGMVRT